jgi:hypothetical protein
MKLSDLAPRQVLNATATVRRELRACENAYTRGDRGEAFAAAERAQEAAFNLKQLFALTDEEMSFVKITPVHNHEGDGSVEGCPGCFPGEVAFVNIDKANVDGESTGAERYFEERSSDSPEYRQALEDARDNIATDEPVGANDPEAQ